MKIDNIKINENIIKDLELKKAHLGLTKKTMTGNIYLDKPWVVKYKEPIRHINEEATLYQNYYDLAQDNLEEIAIFLPDTNEAIKHKDLLNLIDQTASGLKAIGIKEGTKIGAILSGTIEEPVFLLASSKIGATIHFMDFCKPAIVIEKLITSSEIDLLVIDDMLYPQEPSFNKHQIKTIICDTRRIFRDGQHLSFNQLLQQGQNIEAETVPYKPDNKSVIIYSSGTTGSQKPIVHTDQSLNNAAQKVLYSDFPLGPDTHLLKCIPPYIGLGLITTLYTGLVSGSTISLIRGTCPEELVKSFVIFVTNYKNILKENNLEEKPLSIFSAPMFYRALLDCEALKDLSFVNGMLAAGSKMGVDELKQMDVQIKNLGCQCSICNGYGQNEMGGAVTLNDNTNNVFGSAGYPVIGTDVAVVDPETLDYQEIGQEGLIVENSSSAFLEYNQLPEKTQNSYITLKDGTKWFDSKDIGYLGEDYHLYITGRTSRVLIKMDCKIPLDDIEIKIKKIAGINNCAVIVTSPGGSQETLTAFVEIDQTSIHLFDIEELKNTITSSGLLSQLELPDDIEILPSLPLLSGGKIDYQTLYQNYKNNQKTLKKEI